MKFGINIFSAAALALSVFCSADGAVAATCDASIALNVNDGSNANDGCEVGSQNNDKLNPLQVNVDMMFGYDDWIFGGKEEALDGDSFEAGDVDIEFTASGGLQSGDWSVIDTLFDTYSDLMLVVKGAANNNTQPNYVGYLFNSATSGDYNTPFFNPNNNNGKDISHISAYVRGSNMTAIPLPAAGWLLLAGLGGLAAMRRRPS